MRRGPRLPLEDLQPFLLPVPPPGPSSPAAPPERIRWAELFGNDHPVEIEVGFGKGLFLLNAGQAFPDRNFLGIEVVRKYQLLTATRLALRRISNVKVACLDARPFLRDCVVPRSVQTVHVYFPDPWWKKRHHKRRVFTPEFAQTVESILAPGGQLLVVTDVEDYSTMVRDTVREHTRMTETAPPEERQPEHDLDFLTHFERKFRQEGRPIYRMRFLPPEIA
ncbi:MAG: tRNA (guanosine(46)-N7)-methyltransferase TrmB [Gemmataceae bacterium]